MRLYDEVPHWFGVLLRSLRKCVFRPRSDRNQENSVRKPMRGVVFHGERELELMQFPDPAPDLHYQLFDQQVDGKGVFLM
jgi:hypothetical protein